MKKSLMHRQNWILVITGVILTYFSYFLISFITTNYDGLYAFFSILMTVIGIIMVVLGLSVRFDQKNEAE